MGVSGGNKSASTVLYTKVQGPNDLVQGLAYLACKDEYVKLLWQLFHSAIVV